MKVALTDVQATASVSENADETRVRILNLLAQREHCVCEFQSILRVPQSKISRHLAYLRRSGLVQTRRDGKWIFYSLAPAANAVHTASDIPLSAYGRGAVAFVGVQDNTDVFFKMMKAALVGTDTTVSER